MKKTTNKLLHVAKYNKKDEFYTQLIDIEAELKHYVNHFKNNHFAFLIKKLLIIFV